MSDSTSEHSTALPAHLLERPAAESARLLAWHHLARATSGRRRLASPEDAEALHDFRVALRRLRSVLQDWRGQTADTVPGRYLRHLRRLSRATGASRDLEVRLELCEREGKHLPPNAAAGVHWLGMHLRQLKEAADAESAVAVREGMPGLEGDLAARLERYRVELDLATYRPQPGTAGVLAAVAGVAASRLERRLAAVHGFRDQQPAHRARIAAKRLRYLLEPFRPELPGAAEAVADLVQLQDWLGDYRDASGLAAELDAILHDQPPGGAWQLRGRPEPDERVGLAALRDRLLARASGDFAKVEAAWLSGAATPFIGKVRGLREALHRIADPREVERKFLLRGLPPSMPAAPVLEVEQGYLPGGQVRERVRRIRRGGAEECWRTIKAGRGVSRVEVEEAIDAEFFAQLWPLTAGSRVHKRRYLVPDGGRTWEVDEFLDRDLVLAEVELDAPDEEVELPAWLAEALVREVTGEAAYLNSTLAR